FGNPVEGTEVSFDITSTPSGATGQTLTTLVAETDENGLLSTELTLGNRPGTYEVTASSNGLTDVIFTATAEAGPAIAYEFDAISSPQTAGQPFAISLTALDDQGNIAESYGETVTLSASQGTITPASAEFTSGTVSADASIDQAGSGITITATDGTISEASNAFDVQTGGVDAVNSSVTASPLVLQAGQNSTLTIDLRDGSNNLVGGLIDADFTISLSGSATAVPVSETSEGIYTTAITNETAETTTAIVTVSGTQLSDTPQIEFTPADADPAATTANVPNGAAGDATSVVITAVDEFGNLVSSIDPAAFAVSVSSGANTVESFSAVTDNGDGTYTTSYTPEATGTDEITITLNSVEISGSPYSSTVTTSDVDASNSSATASPTSLVVGNTSTVTVVLRDGSSNLISGLSAPDFNVDASGSATVSTVSETAPNGTYEFTVSNQVAESVTVTISATGTTINDTPAITFTAGAPERIIVSTQPQNGTAGETIPGPPSVTLEDQFNNPVPSIDVTVSEQGGQVFAGGTLTVQTNEAGTADFSDLVITDVDQYNLVFAEPGGKTATSNAFDIIAAPADAGQTTAAVPNGSAGDKTNITITVNDAFGNSVTGAAGDLAVTISGENPGATFDDITDNGDGTYSTGYTPTSTGDDIVTITLGGTAIQGSPFTSTVITSDAETVEVSTQPQQTVAGEPIAGTPAAFVIDSETNPVPNIDVVVSLQSGSFIGGTETVTTNTSGISEFTDLVINQAGSYVMEFNAQGVADPAASNSFNVVAAAASDLAIESGNNQTATVTETLADPFVVQVTDQFGNAVENETVEFSITDEPASATGQSVTLASTTTDGNGFASTTLTLGNISGDYQVTAISGALTPVVFTATANAGPAASFTFDAISSPQTAGEAFTFSLTAEDSEGNLADGYSGTASLSTTAGTIDPSSADFTSGAATVNVTVSDAGTAQTITAEDGAITGTSNTFDVQSGGVDAANSSASADPTTLQAGQISTLTIELRDGSNNVVGGLADTDFTVSPGGNATAGPVSESSEGIYTTDITNQTAESVTVTITASGTQLNDQPQIEFTPGNADAVVEVSGNNQTGTVLESLANDFVVKVEDQFENPAPNVTVEFTIVQSPAGATGESLSQVSLQTNSAGEAATRLTFGDTPGIYITDAVVDGVGTISFSTEAEKGAPSQMTVGTQPSQTTAGEAIAPAPAVTVTDNADNPIEGVSVTVSEQGGSGFDGGTLTQSTNASGIAEFADLIFNRADTYIMVFNADAPGVSNVNSNPLDIVAAAGDPANSTADVPNGAAGEETSILITILDAFGNVVTGFDGVLSVAINDGPNSGATFDPILDNNDGTYSTAYTPDRIGDDLVTIRLGVIDIAGSPYTSTVSTSDVSASSSSVTANPTELQVGNSSEVTVTVRDASDNLISGLTSADFNISVSGNGTAGSISETLTDGVYAFNVSNQTAQDVTVTVTATGTTLNDQPAITFTAGETDLMLITTEPGISEAGQPIEGPPTVRLTDEFNNPVPQTLVSVTEQGGDPFTAGSAKNVNTNDSGFAIFDNIAIEEAGQYNLVFSTAGVTNRTSNAFDVNATDPDPSQTTATVNNGSAGDPTPISITVRDQFENRVEGAVSALSVSVTGENAGAIVASINDNGNGNYSTSYTPTVTGDDQIIIEVLDTQIPGSPFGSEVITTNAENVAMQQQPLETVAGNAVEGPPSVVVTDDLGNGVPDIEVNVSLNGGSFEAGSTITFTTGSDGIAEFRNLLIEATDSYTLEFNAVGVTENTVSNTFDVVADVANSIELASGNNQTGSVTEQLGDSLVVRVIDQFENTVAGETISFDITSTPDDATGQTLSFTAVDTDTDGLSATDLTLGNRTGTYEVTATLTGIGTVLFSGSAVAGEAAEFQIDEISSPQTVDSPFSISITAIDSEGNTAVSYQGTADLSTTAGTITPSTADFSNGTVS
ncbi:MAG: hypothetical protein LC650_04410, partial [Actinobacteria bacterium]|nr:hypothetical protein [Actinomycetota bacterium]